MKKVVVGKGRRGIKSDVDVGVTLEVRLHRFEKSKNGGRKTGKDGEICKARRRIRI